MCSVDVFKEGVDVPQLDRVVMLRPTESGEIFLQQLGRCLRAHEGKSAVTVIDFMPVIEGAATDPTGLATIELPGAGLDANLAEAKIRARSLARVNDTPLGGEFQVTGAETLVLCVPLYTPEGRYLVTVVPAPGRPPLTFSLDVPARIVLVSVDEQGLAAFAADDAGFETGVTEVYFGATGTQLAETSNDPPDAGTFCLLLPGKNALRLRVPAGTKKGLHFVKVKRGTQKPDFGLWLEVPPP